MNDREYYHNDDYPEMGGEKQKPTNKVKEPEYSETPQERYGNGRPKVNYYSKWKGILTKSKIGNLIDNQESTPNGFKYSVENKNGCLPLPSGTSGSKDKRYKKKEKKIKPTFKVIKGNPKNMSVINDYEL